MNHPAYARSSLKPLNRQILTVFRLVRDIRWFCGGYYGDPVMMKRQVYRIVVYLIEAEADDDGVTAAEIPAATYVTESCCP